MTTLLSILGVILLYIIIKFIYESFLTNKTNENWEKYKKDNPEDAARIERNKGFDFSTKPKSKKQDQEASLQRLASSIGSSKSNLKEIFIEDLKQQGLTAEDVKQDVKHLRQQKYEESKTFNIDPDDTASAFMEKWAIEYLESMDYSNDHNKDDEILGKALSDNPELQRIVRSGNKAKIENYLKNNPEVGGHLMDELAFSDEPAEKYRRKAIDKFFQEKDFKGAIQLINKGLEFEDPQIEWSFYKWKAKCQRKLRYISDALKNIDKGIDSIFKNHPDDYYNISNLYKDRAEINEETGNNEKAEQDKRKAKEYFAKFEENKRGDDEEDDLPF